MHDLTAEADRSKEDEILYDPVTGLPGRLLQRAHLVHALKRASRNGTRVAVLFLDIDDFKDINGRIGREHADEVLVVLAARIEACLRGTDMTARLDADEFLVVCEDVADERALQVLSRRLSSALATPMQIGDLVVEVRVSVGAALGTGRERAGELLHAADLRMAASKEQRKAAS